MSAGGGVYTHRAHWWQHLYCRSHAVVGRSHDSLGTSTQVPGSVMERRGRFYLPTHGMERVPPTGRLVLSIFTPFLLQRQNLIEALFKASLPVQDWYVRPKMPASRLTRGVPIWNRVSWSSWTWGRSRGSLQLSG
jgi:hypothetical protein